MPDFDPSDVTKRLEDGQRMSDVARQHPLTSWGQFGAFLVTIFGGLILAGLLVWLIVNVLIWLTE